MASYLDVIVSGLIGCIEGLSTATGYNYSYTTQQLDFNKVTSFPLCNLSILDERVTSPSSFLSINSLRVSTNIELKLYNKLPSAATNAEFNSNSVNHYMLNDILRLIGNNNTLSGLVEYVGYTYSSVENSGFGEDVMIPRVLTVVINIIYSMNNVNPSVGVY